MQQNLPKSTKCMTDSTEMLAQGFLNAEDICKILKASRESGVLSLKCGPLEVCFGPSPAAALADAHISGAAPTPAAEDLGQITQAQQKAEEASLLEEEINTKDDQIAEMLITDPLRFEELMERGELEPGGIITDGSGQEAFDN